MERQEIINHIKNDGWTFDIEANVDIMFAIESISYLKTDFNFDRAFRFSKDNNLLYVSLDGEQFLLI